jgi:hypothetical protein
MTALHFQTQVSDSGVITLPPEYRNRKVVVSVDKQCEKPPITKKRKATADEIQNFMDTCYGCLGELSDAEFERLKMERILEK